MNLEKMPYCAFSIRHIMEDERIHGKSVVCGLFVRLMSITRVGAPPTLNFLKNLFA